MRRILIVDDEQPVASGIAHIVRRDFPGRFELAGLASSGREAVEKVGQLSPDIILMDVRMPGFSGLEAIRELRKRGSNAAFVMVTAYERFEIAREAIELGVVDYLLKPVASEALALSLSVASAYLDHRDDLERKKLELKESLEQTRTFAEKALLYCIISGGNPSDEISAYINALGIQGTHMAAAALRFPRAALGGEGGIEVSELYKAIWKAIKYKTDFLLSPPIAGLCMVLMPLRGQNADNEARSAAAELETLLASFGGAKPGDKPLVDIGFGRAQPYGNAGQSWNEAVTALYRRTRAAPARRATPSAPGSDAIASSPAQPIGEILQDALIEGSESGIRLALDAWVASRNPGDPPKPAEICSMIAFLEASTRTLRRDSQIDVREASEMMAMDDLYTAPDFASFANASRARIMNLVRFLKEASPRYAPAVRAAMAYVRRNFAASINLESAAGDIGISPGRLSRLFVEETGKGFSHYLIAYRVAKAKEMLAKPGASIKEVSVACGYPDQNYFARLFKKVTGLTPSSFIPQLPEERNEN